MAWVALQWLVKVFADRAAVRTGVNQGVHSWRPVTDTKHFCILPAVKFTLSGYSCVYELS